MSKALENLRKNLVALMQQRDWSQSETARRSGIPQNHISQYVLGKTKPGIEALEDLSRAFGVSIAALLGNDIPQAMPLPADPLDAQKLEVIGLLLKASPGKIDNCLLILKGAAAAKKTKASPA